MLTAADVRSARFTATKFRSGYEIVEVDEFLARSALTLEHLEQGLTVEADGTPLLTPADLLAVRFSPTHLTEGYFVDEVDDLLDGIIDALNTYIGRAERGESLVQPVLSAHDDAEDAAAPGDAAADDVVDDAHAGAGADADAESAPAVDALAEDAPAEAEAPADSLASPEAAIAADGAGIDHDAGGDDAEPFMADASPLDSFPSEPVWAPPASTDVMPSAWDAPAPTVATPLEPASFTSDEGEGEPEGEVEPAPADSDDWVQPVEQTSPWSPPAATRWTAPTSGAEDADDADDDLVATAEAAFAAPADEALVQDDVLQGDVLQDDVIEHTPAHDDTVDAAASADLAPWEPGFVPPATPIATPDWGFTAPAASSENAWSVPADAAQAEGAPVEPGHAEAASLDTASFEAAPFEVTPVESTDDLGETSLLTSTDESPWASLDGDEPVALDLEDEVRDAERGDAELPAWLTDAQPEMAEAAPEAISEEPAEPELSEGASRIVDEPAGETPTRVSAFALAAQAALPEPTPATAEPASVEPAWEPSEPEAATAVVPVAAPADTFAEPQHIATPEHDVAPDYVGVDEAPPAPAPYTAPEEALDSQGFLRQLTFARATSTGSAKDSITLVGPDGAIYSAINVRKTAEGLVVDLG